MANTDEETCEHTGRHIDVCECDACSFVTPEYEALVHAWDAGDEQAGEAVLALCRAGR